MDASHHLRRLQWQIAETLTEHELLAEQYWDSGRGARWVVGKPGTGVMRAEIIAGIHGSLIVHGDVDVMRYAAYGDHADAWSRLKWMGLCNDVGYYVAQKASIGMGRVASGRDYDSEVALHDLRERRKDHAEGGYPEELLTLLQQAEAYVEDQHELQRFLYENDKGWDLWELTLGEVVSTPVVVTHLCLQKTACLLLEKYGNGGPPLDKLS